MKTVVFLILFLSTYLCADDKPNFVILLNGKASADSRAPYIDRAASKGVRFRFTWASVDGQRSTKMVDTGSYGSSSQHSLTELLKDAGYSIASLEDVEGKRAASPFFLKAVLGGVTIEELDKAVAQFLDLENTWLFVASCTGHDASGKNPNAAVSVPLVVSGPGIVNPGRQSWDLVDFTDFYPTIAALAGIELEKPVDGKSFAPSLKDSDDPYEKRNWIYTQSGDNWMIRDWANVLTSDGKFVKILEDQFSIEEIRKTDKIAPHRKERLQMLVDRLHKTLK